MIDTVMVLLLVTCLFVIAATTVGAIAAKKKNTRDGRELIAAVDVSEHDSSAVEGVDHTYRVVSEAADASDFAVEDGITVVRTEAKNKLEVMNSLISELRRRFRFVVLLRDTKKWAADPAGAREMLEKYNFENVGRILLDDSLSVLNTDNLIRIFNKSQETLGTDVVANGSAARRCFYPEQYPKPELSREEQ